MNRVAQLWGSFQTTRKPDTGLGRSQRQPIPQQGFGDLFESQHKMQVVQRRARQKRHIFKGFRTCRSDPCGHPG